MIGTKGFLAYRLRSFRKCNCLRIFPCLVKLVGLLLQGLSFIHLRKRRHNGRKAQRQSYRDNQTKAFEGTH